MDVNEAIKLMLAETGTSQKQLAYELGGGETSTNSKVSGLLRSGVKVNTFARIADILGYDVMIVKRGGGNTVRIDYDPDFKSKRSKK